MEITPAIPDTCLQKLIGIANNDSLDIVTIIKDYAYYKNISLNHDTLKSLLNLNQKQIDTLFLENIENNALRPIFLNMGANINTTKEKNQNCLWYTTDPHILKELINKGATVDAKNIANHTILHILCYYFKYSDDIKYLGSVEVLLKDGKADPNIPFSSISGCSLLYKTIDCAKDNIKFKAVELLCKYGAHCNEQSSLTDSPLILAIEKELPDIVELLLENKANPNLPVQNTPNALHKRSPLQIALKEPRINKNSKLIKLPIVNSKIIILLLHYGANPNEFYGPTKNSPLHVAVLLNLPDVIRELIQCGANKNYRNNEGYTAFDLAQSQTSYNGIISTEIIKLLNPNSIDIASPTQQPKITINSSSPSNKNTISSHSSKNKKKEDTGCFQQ